MVRQQKACLSSCSFSPYPFPSICSRLELSGIYAQNLMLDDLLSFTTNKAPSPSFPIKLMAVCNMHFRVMYSVWFVPQQTTIYSNILLNKIDSMLVAKNVLHSSPYANTHLFGWPIHCVCALTPRHEYCCNMIGGGFR